MFITLPSIEIYIDVERFILSFQIKEKDAAVSDRTVFRSVHFEKQKTPVFRNN